MRSAIRWSIRLVLLALSIESVVRLVDWGGRWEWLKGMLETHPTFALFVRGPFFPLLCLMACLVIIYGDKYLSWPDIRAEILRVELHPKLGLVPVKMMDEIYKIVGNDTYSIDCDLMAEVFLVNYSETDVTIRDFVGTIKVKSKKVALLRAEDFSRYTLKTVKKTHEQGFANVQTTYTPLGDLIQQLTGTPLRKGIGHQGWLGFTAKGLDRKEAEKVKFDLYVVDALGHRHPIRVKKSKIPATTEDVPVLVGPVDG